MNGHTPGPWWIDEDGEYLCICEGDVNECGEREEVALLHCNRPSLRATQPANARLIAAAPELLEELKEAEKVIRWAAQESAGRVRAEVVNGWLHHAKKIGGAIAKAEGGNA